MLEVTHPFVSGKSDGPDATEVQPSNWNAKHTTKGSLRNFLHNGAMDIWQRGSTGLTALVGVRTFRADRWAVVPAGANATVQQAAVAPTGAKARYALQVVGATSVTTVDISQRVVAEDIPEAKRTVTFQFQIYNNTGADFTPSLLLGTPAAADNFTTVTNRLTQVLGNCVNGAWSQVSHTVDISAFTNIDNGLQIDLRIPSGSLNSAAKDVRITEAMCSAGSVIGEFQRNATNWDDCQSFWMQTYPYGTAVGTATAGGGKASTFNAGGSVIFSWDFPTRARGKAVNTSVTIYDYTSGTAGKVRDSAAGAERTATLQTASPLGVTFSASGGTANGLAYAQLAYDGEP